MASKLIYIVQHAGLIDHSCSPNRRISLVTHPLKCQAARLPFVDIKVIFCFFFFLPPIACGAVDELEAKPLIASPSDVAFTL